MDTKEKITDVALHLFSENGYNGVSVRDICGKVGIRESTIYYHFKNKQDILDQLSDAFLSSAKAVMKQLTQSLNFFDRVEKKDFSLVTEFLMTKFFLDEDINKFIRVLLIEQARSKALRQIYHRWLFEVPVLFFATAFGKVTDNERVVSMDKDFLAMNYYAPIFLYFQQYLTFGELEQKELFLQKAEKHIHSFLDSYGI
jgi:AcrR family transcriptional regulator